MSFICDFCKEPSPVATPQRLVPETRDGQIVRERRQCQRCYDHTPQAMQQRMADGKTYMPAEKKETA